MQKRNGGTGRRVAARVLPIAIVTLVVFAVHSGCGRARGTTPPNKDGDQQGAPQTLLEPLSFLSQQAYPGDTIALKVLVVRTRGAAIAQQNDLAAVPDAPVAWQILGSGGGNEALTAQASLTSATGVAEVQLQAGTAGNRTVQVQAVTSGAPPVVFSVRVAPDEKQLVVVNSNFVSAAPNRRVALRVRLQRPSQGGRTESAPIPNYPLHVRLIGGARNGAKLTPSVGAPDGAGDSFSVTTHTSGAAAVTLHTGTQVGETLEVVFCDDATACPGIAPVRISVNVSRSGSTAECTFFTDCGSGQACQNGTCVAASQYCNNDTDCGSGYRCSQQTRQCERRPVGESCSRDDQCDNDERCGEAETCIDADGCLDDDDCGAGEICTQDIGACTPGSRLPPYDLRGTWDSRYHLNISNTLPPFFTDGMGPVVDFLDLVFRSQLDIGVPILGDIVEAMIDAVIAEYIPPWVRTVNAVLVDFVHLFETMEAAGHLQLSQSTTGGSGDLGGGEAGGNSSGGNNERLGVHLRAQETWHSAEFFLASLCPGGAQEFARDRRCGMLDVIMQPTVDVGFSNQDPTVGVRVDPFAGRVRGDQVEFNGRRAEVAMRQLVNIMLDLTVTIGSNGLYWDFETFLVDVIPCDLLADEMGALACDSTGGRVCNLSVVELLCDAASLAATAALTEALGQVAVGLSLHLDQSGPIGDRNDDRVGDSLGGSPDGDGMGRLRGDARTQPGGVFAGPLGGDSWWTASRPGL